ncbi:hypothetical protein QE152_g24724 [Popillia japonica]|uniref:Uncharacterized protein n=1 Tax=Popillia japonica TaxID=7064 RepID=A0AAW1K4L5_POPJA
MEKITIAACIAICGTVIIAAVIFIVASRRQSPPAGPYTASPGGPLSSLPTISAFNNSKDWDQISGYSTHSTQRPRMYALDQPSSLQDDLRSHFSSKDLRQSRQSLAMHSDRMMKAPSHHGPPHSVTSSTRRSRPRSRSRDHHRPGSRYSITGSTHTLNNYCDNSDNWTDHDMEIYMARNPTTRNGLVPL